MPEGTRSRTMLLDTSPSKPSVSRTRRPPPGMVPRGWNGLSARGAQAACCFKCLASKRTSFFLMPRAALGRACRLPDYAECRRVSVLNFLISVGFHALAANCIRHNPAVFSGLAVTPGIRKTYEEKTCVGRETHSRQPVRVACSDVCNRVEGCGEVDYRDRTICSKPIRSALNRPYTTR